MTRQGRKARHFTTPAGEVITGLCRRANGRFYPTGRNDICFGSDPLVAVHKYRLWASQQEGKPEPLDHSQGDNGASYWRNLILTDSKLASQLLDIPQLEWFSQWKPPQQSATLSRIGQEYIDNADVTEHWKQLTQKYWTEFSRIVKARTVSELTQQDITRYHDAIKKAGKSATYINHRFGAIKTVFSFAKSRGLDILAIGEVLQYCSILKSVKRQAKAPSPISREDYHKLLNAANDKWKALLLCALNLCLHGSEVAELRWSEIDLNKGTFISDRKKTGVVRIGVLWKRTIEALKALKRTQLDYVFITREGNKYDPNGLRNAFKTLRRRIGMDNSVLFGCIRDGSYSSAVQYSPTEQGKAVSTNCMLLAGHRSGMADHYVKRNPKMVQDACLAVEKAYFG